MKNYLFLLFLAFSTISYAQNEMPQRSKFKLKMAIDESNKFEADIPESPYFVKEKILQLYCGEKVFIECEIKADSIHTMKVVAKNKHPEKTIIIEFYQKIDSDSRINTFLTVKNPFDKILKYDANMYTLNSKEWVPTSILPILPNLLGIEHWPHPIITFGLDNWRIE